MVYGESWTAARVTGRLIVAFQEMQGVAIRSSGGGDIVELLGVKGPVDGLRLIQATAMALGRTSIGRKILLTYCHGVATAEDISQICLEMSLSRSVMYRKSTDAAECVAAWLNSRPSQYGIATGTLGEEEGV